MRWETSGTHRVPHDDVDIGAEGVVYVLGDVEVDKVTEMVVHVHPCWENKCYFTECRSVSGLKEYLQV